MLDKKSRRRELGLSKVVRKLSEYGNDVWTKFAQNFLNVTVPCTFVDYSLSMTYTGLDCKIQSKSGKWSDILSFQVTRSDKGMSIGGKMWDLFDIVLAAVSTRDKMKLSIVFDRDNSRQYLSGVLHFTGIVKGSKGQDVTISGERKFKLPQGNEGQVYLDLSEIDSRSTEMSVQTIEVPSVETFEELFDMISQAQTKQK